MHGGSLNRAEGLGCYPSTGPPADIAAYSGYLLVSRVFFGPQDQEHPAANPYCDNILRGRQQIVYASAPARQDAETSFKYTPVLDLDE